MSVNAIQQKIALARPPLSKVSPLAFFICWGYVVVNIILGLGMIFLYSTPVPIAVASILPYWAWGVAFLGVSVLTSYGLVTNKWEITRGSQIYGLVLKGIWGVALVIRCFYEPRTILITGVWLFFTYVQAAVYIHFFPPLIAEAPDE